MKDVCNCTSSIFVLNSRACVYSHNGRGGGGGGRERKKEIQYIIYIYDDTNDLAC